METIKWRFATKSGERGLMIYASYPEILRWLENVNWVYGERAARLIDAITAELEPHRISGEEALWTGNTPKLLTIFQQVNLSIHGANIRAGIGVTPADMTNSSVAQETVMRVMGSYGPAGPDLVL